jgi:putative membrane protein
MNKSLMTLLASQGDHWDHSWWPIWPLLWIGVIVTIVWFFKRRHWTAARPQSGGERARDILAERFARGEITNEEYRDRLEQLQ